MIVEELVSVLGLEIDPNVATVTAKFKGLVDNLMDSPGKALGAAAVAVGAAAGAFSAAVFQTASAADAIGDAAARIGIGTTALQELKFAAEQNEVPLGQLEQALLLLQASAKKAVDGNKELQQSFAGISLRGADGKIRSANELFSEVAERIKNAGDRASQIDLARNIFGKSGAQLVPLLTQGSEGLANFSAEAQRLGIVMSEDTVNAAGAFDENLKRLKATFGGFVGALAGPAIPLFSQAFVYLTDVLVTLRPVFADLFSQVGEALSIIGRLAAVVAFVLSPFTALAKAVGLFVARLVPIKAVVLGVAAAMTYFGVQSAIAFLASQTAAIAWVQTLIVDVVSALIAVTVETLSFEATTLAAAAASAAAWLAATLPLLLLAGTIILVADEIYSFTQGYDTLIGRAIKWADTTTEAGKPVLAMFKALVALLFDLTDPKKWDAILPAIFRVGNFLSGKGAGPSIDAAVAPGNFQTLAPPVLQSLPLASNVSVANAARASSGRNFTAGNTTINVTATEQDGPKLAKTIADHMNLVHEETLATFTSRSR